MGVIALMALPRLVPGLPALRGGDAAALVGGVAFMLMMLATLAAEGPRRMLDVCPEHVTDGFVFAFRAMGSVLPIAGFFFIGAAETAAPILGLESGHAPGLLFDLISAAQHLIPENHYLVAFGVLLVGMVTGIDGSGFAGLPLTGTLSGALGPVVGIDPATLAAVGQMGAVWTGGGTLIAWSSLIAVAGFARVHVLDMVRALMLPVLLALSVSTIAAILIWS
ncbi:integral membrane protein [Bordetella pertussis]|nr:integral membrane protein [Bordetella pertussis]